MRSQNERASGTMVVQMLQELVRLYDGEDRGYSAGQIRVHLVYHMPSAIIRQCHLNTQSLPLIERCVRIGFFAADSFNLLKHFAFI